VSATLTAVIRSAHSLRVVYGLGCMVSDLGLGV
jgi:hypothetical protein